MGVKMEFPSVKPVKLWGIPSLALLSAHGNNLQRHGKSADIEPLKRS